MGFDGGRKMLRGRCAAGGLVKHDHVMPVRYTELGKKTADSQRDSLASSRVLVDCLKTKRGVNKTVWL